MNKETTKIIEKHLGLYRTYKATIENCKRQLDYMLPSGVTSYDFNGSSGGGIQTSTTERSALERLESKRAIELNETIKRYTLWVEMIDNAVNGLEEVERKFLECRYQKNYTQEAAAEAIGYSLRTTYTIKKVVLSKLEISLGSILDC